MRKKPRVYLGTSVISALLDEKNPERMSLTQRFFEEIERFDAFISQTTLDEIERTPDQALLRRMKEVVSPFSVLLLTDEVKRLAEEYVLHGGVPETHAEDAYHIAMAVVNEMEFLLS